MTSQYTNPPEVAAGDEWTADDFKRYVLDNIRNLNSRIGSPSGGSITTNSVVVGGSSGALVGLQLPNGALLVGGSTAPTTLAAGTAGYVLTSRSGAPQWRQLSVSIDRDLLLRYLH